VGAISPFHPSVFVAWNSFSLYNFTCCLYGYESCSFTLQEEHGLRVCFENRVTRNISGIKRDEMKRGLKMLHSSYVFIHGLFNDGVTNSDRTVTIIGLSMNNNKPEMKQK
jgi:hypothetical protein